LTEIDQKEQTISLFFKKRFEQDPEKIAFYYKDLGIYHGVSWKEYWEEVEEFYLGLLELGIKRGDRVAIMGEPCRELFYADLAILSAGAISFGVYTTFSSDETIYTIERTKAKFFIGEGQEHVDKILPFIEKFPFLLKIIVTDRRSTFMYQVPRLISFTDVQELGKKRKMNEPDQLRQAIQQIVDDDLALIVFTPGTTGLPKPAVFSHRNIISFLHSISEMLPKLRTHEQRIVCYQDLAHPSERFISLYFPMLYDVRPYIGEKVESFQETLFEVQPTFFHGLPRIWKKLAGRIIVGIERSSWPKELSYRWAMKVGWNYMRLKRNKEKATLIWRVLHWIAEQISFRHIRHQLGFSKIRYAISVGGPLPAHIHDLWQIWGVNLLNAYGVAESAGVIISGFSKSGEIGKLLSIHKMKLSHEGELLLSGPPMFCGYWGDEEKTHEVIKEGWFYTGDIFEYGGDGSLNFIDRKQDIAVTDKGRKINPTPIENLIKSSPYINDVIVSIDRQHLLSALIEIDFDAVSEWARRNNVLHAGFTSLLARPEVDELIEKEVRKANQYLSREEQVQKIRILQKQLNPGSGEITPTGKIRRHLVNERFGNLFGEINATEVK